MKPRILIVDDEPTFIDSVVRYLRLEGYTQLTPFIDPVAAAQSLSSNAYDIAFLDITMPEMDGLELLRLIKEQSPATECVMVTAHDAIAQVTKAMRAGAYDYLVKPVMPQQMLHAMERALERQQLVQSLFLHTAQVREKSLTKAEAFAGFITVDEKMLRLLREAELHAASEMPVLLVGETGVGKELLARAVHQCSARASKPFVPVNMLAINHNMFEAEFFGHVKGAFTGADRDRPGYLAQAEGGTIFLDEIGDLPLEMQGKLLRVLQEQEYSPVGKNVAQTANVRFIAATNQDLQQAVAKKKFRADLFYRLRFAYLQVPPLRQRREDIPLLALEFLRLAGKRATRLSENAKSTLLAHDWPGNVRELKATITAAANLAQQEELPAILLSLPAGNAVKGKASLPKNGESRTLAEVEREHILAVYEQTGRNKSQTARILDIGLHTLQRKLKMWEGA